MSSLPLSLRAYRCATAALEPVAPIALRRRAQRGKEDPARLSERLGNPSRARPDGALIWIHGVSVGESLSALPLIDALLATPGRSVLMTSGTVTSAEILAERLPQRAFHQFAPVDTPAAVARFLSHWQPDVGLFVDSEIWPNMLMKARSRGIKLAIVNGRMSEKSFARWRKAKKTAAGLLSLFDICLAQDAHSAARFKALGAPVVRANGNLKADAEPLSFDPNTLEELRQRIGERPVLLATNTHPGEDEILIAARDLLRVSFPSLLTIIVPRHAERGADIAALCAPRSGARRSQGQGIDQNVDVYIADTMGELGLFYRLAPFAFVGKSLAVQGGQNPIEAARLGTAVLAGPYTDNFRDAYDAIFAAQGLGRVSSAEEIAALAARLICDPTRTREIGAAARDTVVPLGGALERTRAVVEELLRSHART